jgi:antitoxin (DNA-binding transcriptional repressor) of toxin-antitoxin stability system
MYQVGLEEAKVRLVDLIEAALRGEDVFIVKNDSPVVQLIAVPKKKRRPLFGSARGLIHMAEDFDASLDDFEEYMP